MEQIELKTKVRKTTGNSPARALRREGKIPAVLYGRETAPLLLSVDVREFEQVIKNANIGQVLLSLVIQNGEKITKSVMIKELQSHPVTGRLLHIDFYEIDMQRKIRVMVPVVAKGQAKGVEAGGLLQIVRRELEVLCLPSQIPNVFEIDITDLDIGDSVHAQEIPLEGDVELVADANFTVLTILSPKIEVAAEEEEAEEAEEGEEAAAEEEAPESADEE